MAKKDPTDDGGLDLGLGDSAPPSDEPKPKRRRRSRKAPEPEAEVIDPEQARAILAKMRPHLCGAMAMAGYKAGYILDQHAVETVADSMFELMVLYMPKTPDPKVIAWGQLVISLGMLGASAQPLEPVDSPPLEVVGGQEG